jgi:glycosyltransferase involved in cell wall biosynthesis
MIHGLCVVKNEADIIAQTLRAATGWCDRIYVLDNGSRDGTWETVQALAEDLPSIRPYRQDPRPFEDSIRGDILRAHLNLANIRDWWCILDADEFYIDDPRVFLARVPRRYNGVWMQRYEYLFTDADLAAYEQHPELYADTVPIEDRLRYYVVGEYSELRFFRHSRKLMDVPGQALYPIYPRRIRLKHFAYRSPAQIQRRLETRLEPMQRGIFPHEKRANWLPGGTVVLGPAHPDELPRSWDERVTPSAGCHFDRRDGFYAEPVVGWIPPQRADGVRRVGIRRLGSWIGSWLMQLLMG